MRQVTRTSRRDAHEQTHVEEAAKSSSEDEGPQTQAAPAFTEGKAYDALLTLLKSDHKTDDTRMGAKRRKVEESEDETIAGFNVTDDEGDDDEAASADDDDDTPDGLARDPYECHFNLLPEAEVDERCKDGAKWALTPRKPIAESNYTSSAQMPPRGPIVADSLLADEPHVSDIATIKQRVRLEFSKVYPDALKPLESDLLHSMLSYRDVNFPCQNYKNVSYKKLYLLHVLNHVFKTRDRVLKNNEKLRVYSDKLKSGTLPKGSVEPELRDQGFTRPKVLILMPTRNAAYEIVEQLIKLSASDQQENHKKFKSQFFQEGGPAETKPADFREMFKGNSSDFFSLGIKFTRKTVKLYSSFYNSDILIASPIGLSMILEDPKQSKRQYDFLSSIEILIMDHANQMEMQNWDHVSTVLKYVNKIPKEFHDADFSRIRMWSINDQASFFRQTLVFSEYLTPTVNNIVSRSKNLEGKIRYRPEITTKTCIMNSVGLKIKQIFQRFDALDPQSNHESRYKFFVNSVLPTITKQASYEDGLLIYIPSYFDYVRVKAYMKNNTKYDFSSVDEYLSQAKVSRARHSFAAGKAKILLYTERVHHFRRFEIAGVKNVLVYEVPANPLFYKELLRFVGRSVYKEEADVDLSFVKTLYSRWDAAALERIVGNERAPVLCNSVNEAYEFR